MDSIYHVGAVGDAFFHDLHQEQIMLDQDAKDISNKVLEVGYIILYLKNIIFSSKFPSRNKKKSLFSVFATRIDSKILSSGSTISTFVPSKSCLMFIWTKCVHNFI